MHSNNLNNPNLHHLYCIYDYEKREIYKFGISDKPINDFHSSDRIDEQVTLFNKVVDWERFKGRILIYDIKGRIPIRILEDETILKFLAKHGYLPRGNEGHRFLKDRNKH